MNINKTIRKSDLEYPACPICSGESRKIKIHGKPFSLVECDFCGLNYIYPRVKEKIGMKLYEKLYLKESVSDIERRFSDCSRFMWNIGILIPHLNSHKKNLRIYDLGSRGGGFVHLSKYILGETIGFDLKSSVKTLAKTDYSYLDVRDINDLKKFPKADLVTCLHVLEHLYQPREFMRKVLKPSLKKGGVALIEVPNWGSSQANKQMASWGWYQPVPHIIQFTVKPLSELLRSEGFQILEIYEDFPLLSRFVGELSIGATLSILLSKILNRFGLKRVDWNRKGDLLGIIVRKK
jgi:SAM-dependent methyltransferase